MNKMGARRAESTVNVKLAEALRCRHPQWNDKTVVEESTRLLREAGKRPDILVRTPGRQPVCIETEFYPARTVEEDAKARLGELLLETGEAIEGVLAVKLPQELAINTSAAAEEAQFGYSAHLLSADGSPKRFPAREDKWLQGGVDDLADAIEHLSLSEKRLSRSTEELERIVRETAGLLAAHVPEDVRNEMASKLHQRPGEQTRRMVAAIYVSAFVFHAAIDGQSGIPRIQPLLPPARVRQSDVLATWKEILDINYWPIFSIACELANLLPVQAAPAVLGRVAESVESLADVGATTYHDLCGRMFQTLISDRKFLATYYTLPSSATLLAELAVDRLDVDWADAEAIARLQVGDFACGTGALLSAVQRSIYRRFRRAGGDDAELHPHMMEHSLVGLDIMPAAAHLTCSMLSAAHPSIGYGRSRIHTMPYGVRGTGVHIGALDFLAADQHQSLFGTGQTAMAGSDKLVDTQQADIPDGGFDLVIMNPPFTRPTNHEASHAVVPVPSFAGFDKSEDEQRHMSAALKKTKGVASHGNAGLATNFLDLAHVKLKDGGVLALVLPQPFAGGKAWGKSRELLKGEYQDVVCVAIAASGQHDRAFSADTGMAECLVIGTKRPNRGNGVIRSWTLDSRPDSLLTAATNVKSFDLAKIVPHLEAIGVLHFSLARAAFGLTKGRLELPQTKGVDISIVPLDMVARRGLVHRDINGDGGRGPFEIRQVRADYVAEYPALWTHAAPKERKLVVQTDTAAEPRSGAEQRARERWNETASRLHSSLDFQLNSQSLAMCLTPQKCIGGTAWPNVIVHNAKYEKALCLWANTTLGLVAFWWAGTRQQQGRARLTITRLPDLPVLDTRVLDPAQLEECDRIFSDLEHREFLPANEAYRDGLRQELDRRMLIDVLGLDDNLLEGLDTLRLQWCSEPSVHGGKKTRPPAGQSSVR